MTKKKTTAFDKPVLLEVMEYATAKGYKFDCSEFINFYESKNWMIGKNKMKDWQAAVRTWGKREAKPGKIRLMPIKGRNCGKADCNLPAVYRKMFGAYDSYYCQDHMPEDVKKIYT